MMWSGIVFGWQMQFLWAVFELQKLNPQWTELEFLLLLSLALLLFVAGSLVVPKVSDESTDALSQFQQDGRWTILILAVFLFLAYITNVVLFNLSFFDLSNIEVPILGIILLSIFFQ